MASNRKGSVARKTHDVRLVEISERSGREQIALVLLLAPLRLMDTKQVANVDGVAQYENVTRAIMPAKIQLVRVNLNLLGDRFSVNDIGDELPASYEEAWTQEVAEKM